MSKIAIVASQGGMTCSYSVGSTLALAKKYEKLTEPDLIIGCSGSSGTLAYYVAKQYSEFRNVWENLLTTKKFMSFRRLYRIMDIDYMIDEVFKKQDPLNAAAIQKSKTEYLIAITDAQTGEPRYVSNHGQVDFFEAIRASCAVPVIFNKQVNIEGKKYIDGAISAHFYSNIHKARSLGAEKIIAIDNARSSQGTPWNLELYLKFRGSKFRRNVLKTLELEKKYIKQYSQDPNVIIITPSQEIPVGTFDINQQRIKDSIKLGYDDVMNNQNLVKFLQTV